MAVCVRFIGDDLPVQELAFFRSLIPSLIIAVLILSSGKPFFPAPRKPLILRGLLGTGALICFFHATQHLPLSVSGILIWCTPLVTYLTAGFLLKERLSFATLIWLSVAFLGLATILSPAILSTEGWYSTDNFKLLDFGIGMLGTLCAGLVFVTIRSATSSHNNNSIVLAFSLAATLITGAWMSIDFYQPNQEQWLIMLVMGITGTLAQLALTQAYRNAPAALVSSMSLMQAPFAIGWGMLIFDEPLSGTHLTGIVIMGFGVVMAVHMHSRSNPKN